MDDTRAGSYDQPDLSELLDQVANLQERMKKLVDMASEFQNYASKYSAPFEDDYNEFYADEIRVADPGQQSFGTGAGAFEIVDDWEQFDYPPAEAPKSRYEGVGKVLDKPVAKEILTQHVSEYKRMPAEFSPGYSFSDFRIKDEETDTPIEKMQEIDIYNATDLTMESLSPVDWLGHVGSGYRLVQNFADEIEVVHVQGFSLRREDTFTIGTAAGQELEHGDSQAIAEVEVDSVENTVSVPKQHSLNEASLAADSKKLSSFDGRDSMTPAKNTETAREQVAESSKKDSDNTANVPNEVSSADDAMEITVESKVIPKQDTDDILPQSKPLMTPEDKEETEVQAKESGPGKSGVIHWNKFPPPLGRRRRG